MTKEEILDCNKLIAQFMGYKYYPYVTPDDPSQEPKVTQTTGWMKGDPKLAYFGMKSHAGSKHHYLCRRHTDLRYFNSWDWIMPVVQKIKFSSIQDDWVTSENIADQYLFYWDIIRNGLTTADLTTVFQSVIHYIKWHNERVVKQPINP